MTSVKVEPFAGNGENFAAWPLPWSPLSPSTTSTMTRLATNGFANRKEPARTLVHGAKISKWTDLVKVLTNPGGLHKATSDLFALQQGSSSLEEYYSRATTLFGTFGDGMAGPEKLRWFLKKKFFCFVVPAKVFLCSTCQTYSSLCDLISPLNRSRFKDHADIKLWGSAQ